MTEFIYSFGFPEAKKVRVVDTDTFKTSAGHIVWQIEDELGNKYLVSPTSLTEVNPQ